MAGFEELGAALRSSFVVERELGRGGMARVYLARDLRHGREVAIKVLHPELAAALGSERFHQEIRVAAGLVHPHIIPLLDSGEAGGFLYFVMPYVPGETLRARLQRERQLPLADAVAIVGQAASALDYAHRRGFIHRDVKPENILFIEDQAVVADFGVARAIDTAGGDRITSSGFVVGTPAYMSPEQAAADPALNGRADEYGLACVAYEMLAGQPPFVGPTAQAITALRLTRPPTPVRLLRDGIPEAVDAAIARALARTPADRHGSPGAFAAALRTAAERRGDGTTEGQADGVTEGRADGAMGRRWRGMGWWMVAGGVVAALAAVLFLRGRGPGPAADPSAPVVAVVPFTPASPDTALERLGRDLAVTVSQTLDGVGGIRTVDPQTVIGRWAAMAGPRGEESARALGAELGAGPVLHGSLVRLGTEVRADLSVTGGGAGAAALRLTVTAPPDSIALLTDSIARGTLAQLFRGGAPPSPSLDAAFRTGSITALRAFLEGEQAFARNDFEGAASAYRRATAADSTFWLAWSRLSYALEWNLHFEDSEAARVRASAHRDELPPRDRLLLQPGGFGSTGPYLDSLAAAVERYPDSWLAWLVYGDWLSHVGAVVGRTMADAGVALGRALALNPDLVPAWEHYAWAALVDRDPAGLARAVAALTRLGAGPELGSAYGADQLLQFRLGLAMLRSEAADRDSLWPAVARDLASRRSPVFAASFLVRHGWPREQGAMSTQVLARGVPVGAEPFHREAMLHALAMRGAWDSVVVELAGGRSGIPREAAEPLRYRVAAVGAWLGLLDPSDAGRHRPAAAAAGRPHDAADLDFRDGVLALARGDRAALDAAVRGLSTSPDSHAAVLARSLTLLGRVAAGSAAAAAELATLEEERGARGLEGEDEHPLLGVVNRLAAARGLTAAADPRRALGLLTVADWRYAVTAGIRLAEFALPFFELERAHAAEALGEPAEARRHYEEFLRLCDRCPAGLVEEAGKGRSEK